jgi:hypothetical protein
LGNFSALVKSNLLVLKSSLDDIDWHRGDGGDHAADHGGAEMQQNSVIQSGSLSDAFFGLRIRAQLRGIDDNRSCNCRSRSAPQGGDSFFFAEKENIFDYAFLAHLHLRKIARRTTVFLISYSFE